MQVLLETERLVLRQFTGEDIDNLVELDSGPEVMHFIDGCRPTPRDEIENDVLPTFLGYYERSAGFGFWAAVERSTGRFIGWFHFRPAEGTPPGEVELGYRLRRSAWGKGLCHEGSQALIDKGFSELGVQRVVASTMVVAVASRRVMENAGLRFVRTFHQPWPYYIDGEEGDVEHALLRSEWEQATAVHVAADPATGDVRPTFEGAPAKLGFRRDVRPTTRARGASTVSEPKTAEQRPAAPVTRAFRAVGPDGAPSSRPWAPHPGAPIPVLEPDQAGSTISSLGATIGVLHFLISHVGPGRPTGRGAEGCSGCGAGRCPGRSAA